MNTPLPAAAVANTLWELSQEKNFGLVSPMKLQKLVYFAHGWHLAYTGLPLVKEGIQAWDYGPVVKDLYHDLKRWGSGEMLAQINEISFANGKFVNETPKVENADLRQFLGNVVQVYGGFSPIQLSNMTHEPGTPWYIMREQFPNTRDLTIPDELIKQYFLKQMPAATK